ncbi:MAG: aspartyl protease family protein [Deltaproteobacteria bacterium]|nr:aspartyl protease family protein [Deltaproteobacteria bacterium]
MGSLPFTSDDGLVRVPVLVWGCGRELSSLSFVVDTGTPRTLLDVGAAANLGFNSERAVRRSRVRTAVGSEEGYIVVVSRLRSLGWERGTFEIACHQLAATAQVDGLLGADFFAGLVLTVNYAAGTVDLAEPAPAASPG